MITIAARIYPIDAYEARDLKVRHDDESFTPHRATNGHPGEADSVEAYSLKRFMDGFGFCRGI